MTLRTAVAGGAAALALAVAPAAQAAPLVCNEAANAAKSTLSVGGGIVDPNPPARFLTDRWALSDGHGAGLDNAADHSPALRQCGAPDPTAGDGSGDGTGSGGSTPPPILYT